MTNCAFVSLSLVLCVATAAAAAPLEVSLTVTEPAGQARKAEPISGGIPLPKGRFREDQPFALIGPGGREVPCQTAPLVTDRDVTVRWVLLDFQADLPAGATRQDTLRAAAPAAKPARALKLTRTADALTVDTGAAKLTISRTQPFGLFSAAEAGGKPLIAGGRISYTDGFTGTTYLAARPESVAVEHAGPMRVTVAVKGRFVGDKANRFRYAARIHRKGRR